MRFFLIKHITGYLISRIWFKANKANINGIPWNIKKYHRNGVLPKFLYVQIWAANHIVKLSGWSSRTLICGNDMLLSLIYGDLGFLHEKVMSITCQSYALNLLTCLYWFSNIQSFHVLSPIWVGRGNFTTPPLL